MWAQLAPLLILALVIIGAIFGTTYLIWRLAAPGLDRERYRPDPEGRRRRKSDK